MFNLNIKTGGAAYQFEDHLDYSHTELIRNLKEIISKLEDGQESGVVMDINGNKVGEWKVW